jgi:hypothetical protein
MNEKNRYVVVGRSPWDYTQKAWYAPDLKAASVLALNLAPKFQEVRIAKITHEVSEVVGHTVQEIPEGEPSPGEGGLTG